MSEWTFNFDAATATDAAAAAPPVPAPAAGEFNPFAFLPAFTPTVVTATPTDTAAASAAAAATGTSTAVPFDFSLLDSPPSLLPTPAAVAGDDPFDGLTEPAPPPVVEPAAAEAEYQIAHAYRCGLDGKSIDFDRAMEYYQKSADGGHAHANYLLGTLHGGLCRRFPNTDARADPYHAAAAKAGHLLSLASFNRWGRAGSSISYAKARSYLAFAVKRNPNDCDALNTFAEYMKVGLFTVETAGELYSLLPKMALTGPSATAPGVDVSSLSSIQWNVRRRAAQLGSEDALLELAAHPVDMATQDFSEDERRAMSRTYYQAAIDRFHNPYAMIQLADMMLADHKRRQSPDEMQLTALVNSGRSHVSPVAAARPAPSPLISPPSPPPSPSPPASARDVKAACLTLYMRGVDLGQINSCLHLADGLVTGEFGPRDEQLALRYYRKRLASPPLKPLEQSSCGYAIAVAELNGCGGETPRPAAAARAIIELSDSSEMAGLISELLFLTSAQRTNDLRPQRAKVERATALAYLAGECELNAILPPTATTPVDVLRRKGFLRIESSYQLLMQLKIAIAGAAQLTAKLAFCYAAGFGTAVNDLASFDMYFRLRKNASYRAVAAYITGEAFLFGCNAVATPDIWKARSAYVESAAMHFVPAMERLELLDGVLAAIWDEAAPAARSRIVHSPAPPASEGDDFEAAATAAARRLFHPSGQRIVAAPGNSNPNPDHEPLRGGPSQLSDAKLFG